MGHVLDCNGLMMWGSGGEELMPVAGDDYPATFPQLTSWFRDDEACASYLAQLNSDALCGFVGSVVTPGATVRTDGWSVYAPLADTFGPQSIAITRTGQPARFALPGVHRVASLLQRWLTGTLHDGYAIDQLDYYLDEFTFGFNRRTARSRGLLFYRLLQQAVATDPDPYRELTTATSPDHHLWA